MKLTGFDRIVLLAAVVAAIGVAAPRPGPCADSAVDPAPRFKQLDGNSDGALDVAEFTANRVKPQAKARAQEAFERFDRDGNGRLTPDEFPPKRRAAPGKAVGVPAASAPAS